MQSKPTTPVTTSSMGTFESNPAQYNNDPKKQAQAIWNEQIQPLLNQGKPVGLIYAANNNQAKKIRSGYTSGESAKISGTGQAEIYAELEKMIQEKKLQDRVHILPIATSKTGGNNTFPNNTVSQDNIDRDLSNIASHKAAGWNIIGIGKQGRYAIGGGQSKGWWQSNFAPISGLSQGQYVQNALHSIATQQQNQWPSQLNVSAIPTVQLKADPQQAPGSHPKWSQMRQQAQQARSTGTIFEQVVPPEGLDFTHEKTLTSFLDQGKIPKKTSTSTVLDTLLFNQEQAPMASNLIAQYAVKSVMGTNLPTQTTIQMVDNNQACKKGHDPSAMKVQFESDDEARAFAKKLMDVHGIHSTTFGQGVMKTPQDGAVYLTQTDLATLATHSKLTNSEHSGTSAYKIMADSYQKSKPKQTVEDDTPGHEMPDTERKITPSSP